MRPDYPSSDDEFSVAPPPSDSTPTTPVSKGVDGEMDIDTADLPPISGPDRKLSLPPVKDLIAEVCNTCEAERLRRHEWNRQHERDHPRHLYSGGDGMILRAVRPPSPTRRERYSVSAYPVAHPHPYLQQPSAAHATLYRPRYATQAHVPSYARDTRMGPLTHFVPALAPPHAQYHYYTAPGPEPDFANFTFGAHSHAPPEAQVAPNDTYSARRGSFASDAPRRRSVERRPRASTVGTTHAAVLASNGRRPSIVAPREEDEPPSSPEMPLAGSRTTPPRVKSTSKPPPPNASNEAGPSTRQLSLASTATTNANPPPFTEAELLELGDKFLLALSPRRTSVKCAWAGGCGALIHEPLTANIVAHLSEAHGLTPGAIDGETTVCLWHDASADADTPAPTPSSATANSRRKSIAGGPCGRSLKVVSMRNHILNCHEKAKTGSCRLCGAFISRAETYLMHRHLTSCVARVARGGPRALEDALLTKGIRTLRDAKGAASFEFVDKEMAANAPEPVVRSSTKSQRALVAALALGPVPPPPVLSMPPAKKAPSPPPPQRELIEDGYDDLDAELDARRMSLDAPTRPVDAPASAMDLLASTSAIQPRMPENTEPTSDAMETS
ncbi:unnamed protein product [Peniophora sp. CBMAI 1063]|nr:unnamed protein product [Peniophora sp. CBMAI 1063]